ncbi:MAG: hypothetical protein H5T65_11425 [Chloroflexi bacterium]|nr:hypothetical protein [Chloroflexota bacterium]
MKVASGTADIRRIGVRVLRVLVAVGLLYVALGLGFHIKWKHELDACRALRQARGEFVEAEVFAWPLALAFDVANWPVYAYWNVYHDGTPFATPCTHR